MMGVLNLFIIKIWLFFNEILTLIYFLITEYYIDVKFLLIVIYNN